MESPPKEGKPLNKGYTLITLQKGQPPYKEQRLGPKYLEIPLYAMDGQIDTLIP